MMEPPARHMNPFVGLRPFKSSESMLFFGRDDQTATLRRRLRSDTFVAVLGSSGSGKSSLVRAGLIPELEGGFLVSDRDRWHMAIMKPGTEPLFNLAQALLEVHEQEAEHLRREARRAAIKAERQPRWVDKQASVENQPATALAQPGEPAVTQQPPPVAAWQAAIDKLRERLQQPLAPSKKADDQRQRTDEAEKPLSSLEEFFRSIYALNGAEEIPDEAKDLLDEEKDILDGAKDLLDEEEDSLSTARRQAAIEDLSSAIKVAGTQAVLYVLDPLLDGTDANLLLLVDQFEEIFRYDRAANRDTSLEDAAHFVSIMLKLRNRQPLYVVMTMRSEFLGECNLFRGFPEALNRSQYLVPRLSQQPSRARFGCAAPRSIRSW